MSAQAGQYTLKHFSKGDAVFTEGHVGDCAYLVVNGSIDIHKVIDGERVVLGQLTQGQIFGEMAIISGEPRTANAVAAESSRLAIIQRSTLTQAVQESPQITQAITKALIDRLTNTTKKVPQQLSASLFIRVCYILNLLDPGESDLQLCDGAHSASGFEYDLLVDKIHTILSISRAEIDLILTKLERIHLVAIEQCGPLTDTPGKFIRVVNPNSLVSSAESCCQVLDATLKTQMGELEFIPIEEFAEIVDTTSDIIIKRLGDGDVPERLFYVNKKAAEDWTTDVGWDFFQIVHTQ